jgi:hypothetical protein
MEDRTWAEGMPQDVFDIQYQRRFPLADVIPDVNMYVENIHGQKVYGDHVVNPEDCHPEMDGQVVDPDLKPVKMNEPKECACEHCGKVCKSHFGLMAHKRHCKGK